MVEPYRRSDAIRHFTLAAFVAAALLVAPATASAFHDTPATPPALHSVHQAVETTWKWQTKLGRAHSTYYWVADRRSTGHDQRWRIATRWWARAKQLYHTYQALPHYAWPDSLTSAFRCISLNEEYGFPDVGGRNTPAGYFGMPSPPSAYPGSAAAVARFGDSWLLIPFDWQDEIAYAELLKYGWYPTWSTAPGCGLS